MAEDDHHDSGWYYKKTSSGKIQQWKIVLKQEHNLTFYYTIHGKYEGKMIQSANTIIKPRKTGSLTIWEKGLEDIRSKINKKVKDGFIKNLNIILNDEVKVLIKAQKYKKYEDQRKKIKFPCYLQPKLDGHNCVCHVVTLEDTVTVRLLTRNGEEIRYLDHIRNDILNSMLLKPELKDFNTDFYLNGELYDHGLHISDIYHLVSKKKNATEAEIEDMLKIKFYVFDCFDLNYMNMEYKDRYKLLKTVFDLSPDLEYVKLIENKIINSHSEIDELLEFYVSTGYEGVMIKNYDSVYKLDKRISDSLKFKPYSDEEFEIIGFKEGKGKMKGAIVFICKTKEGKSFSVVLKGPIEYKKNLLKEGDKLIGKLLKVKYLRKSKDGIPQEPVGNSIRDFKLS